MFKRYSVTVLVILCVAFLILTCIFFSVNTNSFKNERKMNYIERFDALVDFDTAGDAKVWKSITYIFSEPKKRIEVPLISFKHVHPSAPLWLFYTEKVPLETENIKIKIKANGFQLERQYPEGLWQKLIITLPQKSNRIIVDLTYEIKNAVIKYPLFTSYEIWLQVPENVPIRICNITLVVSDNLSKYRTYSLNTGLEASSYLYLLPNYEEVADNKIKTTWNLKNINSKFYPLHPFITISPIPGLASILYQVFFITISAIILILIFEIIYNVSAARRLAEEPKTKFKFPARVHPLLLSLGVIAWYTYQVPLELIGGSLVISRSWFSLIHALAFTYWLLMFFIWPLIFGFNYTSRKKLKLRLVTNEKLLLWIKKSPTLLFIIFLQLYFSLVFVCSLFLNFYATRPPLLFMKTMWYAPLVSILLIITSMTMLKLLKKFSIQENKVDYLIGSFCNVDELIEKARREGIPKRMVNLFVKSLSEIDRVILREKDWLFRIERRIYLMYPDVKAIEEFVKDYVERKEKIKKFNEKYGYDIKPAATPDDAIRKLYR